MAYNNIPVISRLPILLTSIRVPFDWIAKAAERREVGQRPIVAKPGLSIEAATVKAKLAVKHFSRWAIETFGPDGHPSRWVVIFQASMVPGWTRLHSGRSIAMLVTK